MSKRMGLLWALTVLLGCSRAAPERGFRLEGHIDGGGDGEVHLLVAGAFLGYTFSEIVAVPIVEGHFVASGELEAAQMVWVQPGSEGPRIPIFLGDDEATLDVDLDEPESARVSGAPLQAELSELLRDIEALDREIGRLSSAHDAAVEVGDRERALREGSALAMEEARRKEVLRAFALRHADSPLAPYVTLRFLANHMQLQELEPLVAELSAAVPESPYIGALQERVETLRATAVGRPAPDFTLPDPEGREVSLGSFAGKLVLIDFWASWCGPCRAQNPELIRLYESYRHRGFEIVGVGVEFARDPWVEAIAADRLPWTQLSDVSNFRCAPAQLFAVRALPDNVLIGSDGTVLARHVEVARLRELLAELFPA